MRFEGYGGNVFSANVEDTACFRELRLTVNFGTYTFRDRR